MNKLTKKQLKENVMVLFVALCKELAETREKAIKDGGMVRYSSVWKSKKYDNGVFIDNGFFMGIGKDTDGHQIYYNLPMGVWNHTEFAEILDVSPELPTTTDNHYRLCMITNL